MIEPRPTPRDAVAAMRIHAPTERNPKLARFLEAANSNTALKARWHVQQVTAERMDMNDHSWVHLQIVLNRALHLFRILHRSGLKSSLESDYAMSHKDAEVVIAGGCLLHDLGMSIHRIDHEAFSLFLAADLLDDLLANVYEDPERTVVASEILHAIIGHRRRGEPYTLEAGVVRVADALDMAQGRTRLPLESGHEGIHSISAAAVDEVRISAGEERPVKIEIQLNNSAGIFQVDDLLATKIRDTPLEGKVEVVAKVEGETEKRLLSGFRLS
jgi:uncharacterized protein